MFLTSIAKTCKQLGFHEASEDFTSACEFISSTATHTNTMMWIGKMMNCPLDLSGQGQLLKHGKVLTRPLTGSLKKGRKWSTSSQKGSTCHLFLFQQTLVLGKRSDNMDDTLYYAGHIRSDIVDFMLYYLAYIHFDILKKRRKLLILKQCMYETQNMQCRII